MFEICKNLRYFGYSFHNPVVKIVQRVRIYNSYIERDGLRNIASASYCLSSLRVLDISNHMVHFNSLVLLLTTCVLSSFPLQSINPKGCTILAHQIGHVYEDHLFIQLFEYTTMITSHKTSQNSLQCS